MIAIRTKREIDLLRKANKTVNKVLVTIAEQVKPGVKTDEPAAMGEEVSGEQGGMERGGGGGEEEDERERAVGGGELSKKKLRKCFWENFAGMDTPSDVVKTVVVWTGYDEDRDESWVGWGKVVRQWADMCWRRA